MKETNDSKYYGTYLGSEIVCLSPKEILDKFGKMFFIDDKDYEDWQRERVGGNKGIHKLNSDER